MAGRRKRPLARGFVNQKILESLISGDKYGYEIIKEVKDKSDGKIELKQPSLYSSLKRFEQKGLISSYWGDSDIGGRRHYYSITEVGKNYYYQQLNGTADDDLLDDDEEQHDQLSIDAPTLEYSDVYDETHSSFEIDQNESDISTPKYNVSNDDLNQPNQFLTDDILQKMKQQYNVEDIEDEEDWIEEQPSITQNLFTIKEEDQHIQQDMFETIASETISNDEVVPNFENIQQLKQQDVDTLEIEDEYDTEKKPIPLIEEQPINYMDWEDMKKQATIKKSFDMDDHSIVSPSTKEQYNKKVFLDQDERIDVANNVNISLNSTKQYNVKDRYTQNKEQSYEEIKKDDIDYKSILGELFVSKDKTSQPDYETMVTKELSWEDEAIINEPTSSKQSSHTPQLNKQLNIKYYEPIVRESSSQNFVKSNKINFLQSCILAPIICLQALILFFIQMKTPSLLLDGKLPKIAMAVYIAVFSIAIAIPLITLFIYMINPNKRKKRMYHTKNFVWNGIIAMFACLLLVITINMLCGCRTHNWQQYFAQIFVPAILSTNFIIHPLIKGGLIYKVKD